MRKQIIASLGLCVALSGLGISNSAYAIKQAPIDITIQKLYYENKEDANYKQEAAIVTPSQVWYKSQYGDVAFTLYKVDSELVEGISPIKVAEDVQNAVAKGEALPYGATLYKAQVSINDQGIANFSEVEVGASYVVVETVHSNKVEMDAKPVFLKVDAENPGNIKVYLKNKAPKPEEPAKPQEPKKKGNLGNTGLLNSLTTVYSGLVLISLTAILVLLRVFRRNRKRIE